MESVCRFIPLCGRAALLATACLMSPVFAGDSQGLFNRELAKRYEGVEEAQELLKKGDEAYREARYSDAVEAYSGARDLIPDAPVTTALREAATERYAQASVEKARELVRKGDLDGAKKAVDKVLAEKVAPNDPGARAYRDQLNDPIRINQALTAEHGKNVDDVRKLLYTAEGAFNLGKYDEAKATYEKVVRIDPTNSAARRGMERVAAAKSDYRKAAYDHARAERLAEVDQAWETAVPAAPGIIPGSEESAPSEAGRILISNKIERIILPSIALDQVNLVEAVEYLRAQAVTRDTLELDPALKGVNMNVDFGPPGNEVGERVKAKRFDLRLQNVPLSQVLKYINDITQTTYSTDDFALIIRPAGATSTDLISRTYRVPPDFISNASQSVGTGSSAAAPDPFATKPAEGLLAKRRGITEILQASGVSFPEGATASFNASTNTLLVRNTATNQDLVSQIVQAVSQTEPIQVVVTVTMIKTEQRNLEELGYDWLFQGYGMGAAGGELLIQGGTQGNGGNLGDIVTPSSLRAPITAGNRSGDEAVSRDSIDDVIAETNQGFAPGINRAPGALALTGLVDGGSFQGLMRAVSNKKGIDLMSTPSVVTRSGQAATIEVIREFIYPTEYEPPELPNSVGNTNNDTFGGLGSTSSNSFPVTPATPTAFEMKKVGTVLEVLPTVSPDKRHVEVQLNPTLTDFDGFVNYGSPILGSANSSILSGGVPVQTVLTPNDILMPVFSVQRLNTNVTVADGATIVIGGLIQDRIQNVEDKVPVLGNLPMVGRFFQSKVKAPVKKAVVFLVNVKLVDPTGRRINQP